MKKTYTTCDACGDEIERAKFKSENYSGTFQGYGLSIRRNSLSGTGTGEMMEYFVNDELCIDCKNAVVAMLAKRRAGIRR